jgi:hypothetical protein
MSRGFRSRTITAEAAIVSREVGGLRAPCNLIVDTGSNTIAVQTNSSEATTDTD